MKALSVGPQHRAMVLGKDFHYDEDASRSDKHENHMNGIVFHIRHCIIQRRPIPKTYSNRPSHRVLRVREKVQQGNKPRLTSR